MSSVLPQAAVDPLRNLITIIEEDESILCIFCKSSKVDELNLGPFYRRDNITTHYFCMLFSAALKQNGADDEGILGFLPTDIQKEVRRGFRLKCVYCSMPGASVGCCNKKCREIFHFPCGLAKNASFEFHSKFESYCGTHIKHKNYFTQKSLKEPCPICMSPMNIKEKLVRGTCCKLATFHKLCIQKMALSAGYFFKCPMCNRTKHFIHEMRSSGIYVPEQDASWEKDNAFQELYVRYSNCDAEKCLCRQGRQFVSDKGSWVLARCRLCGGAGIHRECGKLKTVDSWACGQCLEVERKAELENKKAGKSKNSAPIKPVDLPGPSTSRGRCLPSSSRMLLNQIGKASIDDEDFKLTNIRISKTCFSYFPYNKFSLRKVKGRSLSDWRTMELRVNLVRWVPPLGTAVPISAPPPPQKKKSSSARKIKPKPKSPRRKTELELEAEEVLDDQIAAMEAAQAQPVVPAILDDDGELLAVPPQKKAKVQPRRLGTHRGSGWSRGIVNKATKARKQKLEILKTKQFEEISIKEEPLGKHEEAMDIAAKNEREGEVGEGEVINKDEDEPVGTITMDNNDIELIELPEDSKDLIFESEVVRQKADYEYTSRSKQGSGIGIRLPLSAEKPEPVVITIDDELSSDPSVIEIMEPEINEKSVEEDSGPEEDEYETDDEKSHDEPEIEMVDLSQEEGAEDEAGEPELEITFPPVAALTPAQVSNFLIIGDQVRSELSQNTNNNNYEGSNGSPGKSRVTNYFSSAQSYRDLSSNKGKQWFSPEKISIIGNSET